MTQEKHKSRLLDINTAAEYLGRTPAAVRKLIERGTIPVTKLDKKIQIDRLVLDKLIEDSTYTLINAA